MSRTANLPISVPPQAGMLALACLAAALLGHLLPITAAPLVPLLSSPGLALFALLKYGMRLWPGVAAGTLAVGLIGGASLPAALAFAAGGTLEALLGVFLLHKAGYRHEHVNLRQVLTLNAVAFVLPPLTAVPLNMLGLSWTGSLSMPLPLAGLNWWANDTLSILLITPLLLTLTAQRRADWAPARLSEAGAMLTALFLAGILSFGFGFSYFTKPFILFPFIIWAVLRFRMAGATATSFLIAHLAAWGMHQGTGPFISESAPPVWSPVTLWAFVAVIAATSQVFATLVEAHRRARQALMDSEKNTHTMLDAITGAAYLIDSLGGVLAVNQAGAKRCAMAPKDLVGLRLIDHLPEGMRERAQELIDQTCRSGLPQCTQERHQGEQFEVSLFPIQGVDGNVNRLAIHTANVTTQKRREAFNTMLQEIDHRVLRHEEMHTLLQFVCQQIVSLFDFEFGWVGLKEANGSIGVLAHAGKSTSYGAHLEHLRLRWDEEAGNDYGPAGQAIRNGQPVFLLSEGPLFSHQQCQHGCKLCATIAIPLQARHEIFGCLVLNSCRLNIFEDTTLVRMLTDEAARRISVALEMAQDVQKLKLLGSALSSAANAVFITDQDGHICWANQAFERLSGYLPDEIIGKTPSILNSGKQNEIYYRNLWSTILSGKTWSNEVIERHKQGHLYTVQQTITPICNGDGRISHFISIHEDITAQKEAAAELERLAHYDLLTGLPNRTLFYTRLRETLALARRNEFRVALLFIDLNRFKQVNDTVGHHTGDLLLQEVAARLGMAVRETDSVARLGGDEFTVILPTVKSRDDAALVAEKIILAFNRPFVLQGYRFDIGVSIGITLYPDDSDSEEQLLSFADMMMYEAKRDSRSSYHFFPAIS